MFGGDPAYLIEPATGGEDDDHPQWRLVVLEDNGEMLAPDAKVQVGRPCPGS